MRQRQAAELKVKIDRADRLDDTQLADLRAEIKVKTFAWVKSNLKFFTGILLITYHKNPKISDTRKFAVITLKVKDDGFSLE